MLISQGGGFDPYSETLTPGIPKWSKTLVFPTNHYKEFSKQMKSTPKLGAYGFLNENSSLINFSLPILLLP
ncbi:MAG: hypothetical protein HFI48_16775 [Lachnospiraceae bacterium]|nr:hypothetical protein [Lachnospiraceae bacterium]